MGVCVLTHTRPKTHLFKNIVSVSHSSKNIYCASHTFQSSSSTNTNQALSEGSEALPACSIC